VLSLIEAEIIAASEGTKEIA
jgi:hypothetical protein